MDINKEYKVYPIGENALTFDFGNQISSELNNTVIALASRLAAKPFSGFIESVPAYSSLTVFYNLTPTKRKFRTSLTAFEIVKHLVEIELQKLEQQPEETTQLIEIPVSFDTDVAPDLEFVAESAGLSPDKVIEIFLARTYKVFMLGFLPGFPYMGEVDEIIATPRKRTPRTKVPKGSVGIAGVQTGIYPLESPGGWQIIGRTSAELFTPENIRPTLFSAGDLVRFIEI